MDQNVLNKAAFREHGWEGRSHGRVGGICYHGVIKPSLSDAAEWCETLAEATHAIVHQTDDELQKCKTSWCNDKNRQTCLIILRVSEGGKSDLLIAKNDKWTNSQTEAVAYVLNARGQDRELMQDKERAKEVLGAFFRMTEEQAKAVSSGELDKLPVNLRALFTVPHVDFLTALLILCQGYLAAHLDELKKMPGGDTEKYLKDTGLLSLDDLEDGRRLLDAMAGNRGDSEKPGWWKQPFDESLSTNGTAVSADTVLEKLREEWASEHFPDAIDCLVRTFCNDGNGQVDNLELVAKAYLALQSKLEEG